MLEQNFLLDRNACIEGYRDVLFAADIWTTRSIARLIDPEVPSGGIRAR